MDEKAISIVRGAMLAEPALALTCHTPRPELAQRVVPGCCGNRPPLPPRV